MTTLPPCPRCASPVLPDWDWCQQCGYDPDGLRPADADDDAVTASVPAGRAGRRSRSDKAKAENRAKASASKPRAETKAPVESRPAPPRQPTDTVYGPLPYDVPSSVVPVESDPPDNSERNNRRFTIVALCVIVVGLGLLIASVLLS